MKSIIVLIAVIAQLVCLIAVSARYGYAAGIYVLCAIIANAIQFAFLDNKK